MRQAGKRVIYQPRSEVIHFEGASHGSDKDAGAIKNRLYETNAPKFYARWGGEIRSHGMPDPHDQSVVDRIYTRRVLVIDNEVPQPDRSAGHYAALQEIRLLQSLGYQPTFLPLNLAHLGEYTEELGELGVETIHAPFYMSPSDFLNERGHEFSLVYVTRYSVARDALAMIRSCCPHARVVLNLADLHFLRLLRGAVAGDDHEAIQTACQVRDDELAVIRQVDLSLSYSDVEMAVVLSHNLNSSKVMRCPWIVEPQRDIKPFEERQDIVFLGGFAHPPNRDAVQYFVTSVMPLLTKSLPGVRLRVFGSAIPEQLHELASERVVIEGYAKSLDQVFGTARLFVAPLLSGAGIKGKVLDALSYGVPSVLSPIAAEGTGIRHGQEALIAQDPTEWAAQITALYNDKPRWQALSQAGTRLIESDYSFEVGRKVLQNALSSLNLVTMPAPYCKRAR